MRRDVHVLLRPVALSAVALTGRFNVPSPEPPKAKAVAAAPTDGIAAAIAPTRVLRGQLSFRLGPRAPHLWIPEPSPPACCWRICACSQRCVCGVWWENNMRHVQKTRKTKNSHVWPFRRLSSVSNQQCGNRPNRLLANPPSILIGWLGVCCDALGCFWLCFERTLSPVTSPFGTF